MSQCLDEMDPRRRSEIQTRLVAATQSLIRPTTLALIATAALFGVMSLWFARPARSLAWVVLVAVAHLVMLFKATPRVTFEGDGYRAIEIRWALPMSLLGGAWGSMPWIMGAQAESGWLLQSLSLTVITIVAGTIAMRMPLIRLAFQVTLLLVGGCGLLFFGGDAAAGAVVLMCASFAVGQRLSSLALASEIASVDTNLDNERLASELRTVNADLSHAVRHDTLTDLPNRSQVAAAVAAAATSGDSMCVGYLDIDRFKLVNDSHGHSAGDQLLVDVAERLREAMRNDDFVSREGGDEFVLVFPNIASRSEAVVVGERVLHAFTKPFDFGDREQRVSASLGLAIGRTDDAAELLRFADSALYEAKDRGRDRFCIFDEELRERVDARVRVEQDLRIAIENGELTGWFQPIVDLVTGDYVGAECLARWIDDRFAETADFMPVAGNLGLVVAATKAAASPAAELVADYVERGDDHPGLRMAINVPPRHAATVIAHVREEFGEHAFPYLTFELTETEMIGDIDEVVRAIDSARNLGAHVVLDDFGTAYSALSLLVELPIDGVKIDQSFVADVENDHVAQAIIAGVVQVSNFLGLSVTAEGVESTGQATTLRQLGVQRGQGFLFSKAVPVERALEQIVGNEWTSQDWTHPAVEQSHKAVRFGNVTGR